MNEKKKIRKHYTSLKYYEEEAELNRESEAGWQLVRGGLLGNTYEQDSMVYRYQMDYLRGIKDNKEYIAQLEQAGWKHIGSKGNVSGWNYFRKIYKESSPKNNYRVHDKTKPTTRVLKQWENFLNIVSVLFLILEGLCFYFFMQQDLKMLNGCIVSFGLFIFAIQFGVRSIHKVKYNEKPKLDVPVIVFIILAFCYVIWETIKLANTILR